MKLHARNTADKLLRERSLGTPGGKQKHEAGGGTFL
jgi:hypothetical protein